MEVELLAGVEGDGERPSDGSSFVLARFPFFFFALSHVKYSGISL